MSPTADTDILDMTNAQEHRGVGSNICSERIFEYVTIVGLLHII